VQARKALASSSYPLSIGPPKSTTKAVPERLACDIKVLRAGVLFPPSTPRPVKKAADGQDRAHALG
jgi:hypothetical protein